MRPHYDFREGVRGKYVSRYRAGTNVVVLDPDVAAVFSSAIAVNRALRWKWYHLGQHALALLARVFDATGGVLYDEGDGDIG
jgi:hypothetical protein